MSSTFCPQCFTGTLRGDVEPTGTVEVLHGLPTYVARPPPDQTPLGVVVIIADAVGWELPNSRALADSYARRGPFIVYLPEFMDGKAFPGSFLVLGDNFMKPSPDWTTMLVKKPWWVMKMVASALSFSYHCREAVVKPRIDSYFRALRDATSLKIGVAGFCFGGRYTILLCGDAFPPKDDGTPLVDCGFTAHPSLVAVPGDVEAVCRPLSVANGDDDLWMGRRKMQTFQKILEEKHAGHEVVVLEGAVHGFAVRGDPRDPRQAELGLQAEDQAVAWFRGQFAA